MIGDAPEIRRLAQSASTRLAAGALHYVRLPLLGVDKERWVQIESAMEGPRVTIGDDVTPLFSIVGLPIAKRAIHTLREGNSYFLRTNSEHGLLSLTVSGPGVRFAFVDGTWLGNAPREAFFKVLQKA